NENQQIVRKELEESRQQLKSVLGIDAAHFAYPDGRFDCGTVQAVAAAGYRCAFTTCQHRDASYPVLTVPRKVFWEKTCLGADGAFSPDIMSCQVNGIFNLLAGCSQNHRVSNREPLAA